MENQNIHSLLTPDNCVQSLSLPKTSDNPAGVDGSVFDGINKAIAADRLAFLGKGK